MPTDISEDDLTFSFEGAVSVIRFDDDTTHGMSHLQNGMKRVDFIVIFAGRTWLIEVKDPENGRIPANRKAAERANFRKKMHSGTLYRRELAPKLRDSLVYLCLANRAPSDKIVYVVFIGLAKLDKAMLLTAQDRLKQLCYLPGPHRQPWTSGFDVVVLNLAAWNSILNPHSVRRGP